MYRIGLHARKVHVNLCSSEIVSFRGLEVASVADLGLSILLRCDIMSEQEVGPDFDIGLVEENDIQKDNQEV